MSQQWCAWSDVTRRSRMMRNLSRITLNFCGCVQIPSLEVMTSKLAHGNSMLIIFQAIRLAEMTAMSRVLVAVQLRRPPQLLRHVSEFVHLSTREYGHRFTSERGYQSPRPRVAVHRRPRNHTPPPRSTPRLSPSTR